TLDPLLHHWREPPSRPNQLKNLRLGERVCGCSGQMRAASLPLPTAPVGSPATGRPSSVIHNPAENGGGRRQVLHHALPMKPRWSMIAILGVVLKWLAGTRSVTARTGF